jgi:hypothetical protein
MDRAELVDWPPEALRDLDVPEDAEALGARLEEPA